MKVPSSLANLVDRVERFLDRKNPRSAELYEAIIQPLSEIGDVCIVGGLVRDLAFYGADERPISDIDFVVSGRPVALDRFAKRMGATPNRFGGYGIKQKGYRVDFWSMSRTWAKKHQHVNLNKPADLVKTTFFDWDGIVYNINTKDIYALPGYLERLNRRRLDINLEATPSIQGNLVRSLRRLVMWDARPGRILLRFIERELGAHAWEEVVSAEKGAFATSYLDQFQTSLEYRRRVLSDRTFSAIGLDDRRQSKFDFMHVMPEQLGLTRATFETARMSKLVTKGT